MPNFIYEGIHGPEFLVSEANGFRSRDTGDVGAMAAATYAPGTVLVASAGSNTVADSADAGNTGNGAATIDAATDASALQSGRYVLTCITAAANGGVFEVVNPEGGVEGTVTVGASAVNLGGLSIAIADGAADFVVGDKLYVDVSAVAGDYAPAAAGTLGNAVGIAYNEFTTSTTDDVEITIIVRDAEVDMEKIQWPTGATPAQKAAGVAALKALGIVARS